MDVNGISFCIVRIASVLHGAKILVQKEYLFKTCFVYLSNSSHMLGSSNKRYSELMFQTGRV